MIGKLLFVIVRFRRGGERLRDPVSAALLFGAERLVDSEEPCPIPVMKIEGVIRQGQQGKAVLLRKADRNGGAVVLIAVEKLF